MLVEDRCFTNTKHRYQSTEIKSLRTRDAVSGGMTTVHHISLDVIDLLVSSVQIFFFFYFSFTTETDNTKNWREEYWKKLARIIQV